MNSSCCSQKRNSLAPLPTIPYETKKTVAIAKYCEGQWSWNKSYLSYEYNSATWKIIKLNPFQRLFRSVFYQSTCIPNIKNTIYPKLTLATLPNELILDIQNHIKVLFGQKFLERDRNIIKQITMDDFRYLPITFEIFDFAWDKLIHP